MSSAGKEPVVLLLFKKNNVTKMGMELLQVDYVLL
jgi:hypothetical protein